MGKGNICSLNGIATAKATFAHSAASQQGNRGMCDNCTTAPSGKGTPNEQLFNKSSLIFAFTCSNIFSALPDQTNVGFCKLYNVPQDSHLNILCSAPHPSIQYLIGQTQRQLQLPLHCDQPVYFYLLNPHLSCACLLNITTYVSHRAQNVTKTHRWLPTTRHHPRAPLRHHLTTTTYQRA